jgi:DNA-binding CsgD family transcriptional regulator
MLVKVRNMPAIESQKSLLTTQCEALYQIFDLLPFGVFVLNRSGEVIAMNGAAKQIITAVDGFVLKSNTLVPVESWQRSEFRSLVMDALDSDRQAAHQGAVMKVFRASEQRPLEVLVMPLTDQGSNGQLEPIDSEPASIVLVCNTDVRTEVPAEALMELYSLTPAEARITKALVRGKRISEAAKDFNLSEQTLRSELRCVFQKTETSRQAELVSVILAGVASFTGHA